MHVINAADVRYWDRVLFVQQIGKFIILLFIILSFCVLCERKQEQEFMYIT